MKDAMGLLDILEQYAAGTSAPAAVNGATTATHFDTVASRRTP